MQNLELNATRRTVIGKQVNALRREAQIPGVIYGSTTEPIALQFDAKELEYVVNQAGRSSIVEVKVAGSPTPYTAIFRDLQYEPIKRRIRHVDLQALSMTETVRLPLPITLVGKAPVEEFGGMVLQLLNEIEIECLPKDLVHNLEVDISIFTEIGQAIHVKDLVAPTGITFMADPEELVVHATALTSQASVDADLETPAAVAAAEPVEVIRKTKEEEAD